MREGECPPGDWDRERSWLGKCDLKGSPAWLLARHWQRQTPKTKFRPQAPGTKQARQLVSVGRVTSLAAYIGLLSAATGPGSAATVPGPLAVLRPPGHRRLGGPASLLASRGARPPFGSESTVCQWDGSAGAFPGTTRAGPPGPLVAAAFELGPEPAGSAYNEVDSESPQGHRDARAVLTGHPQPQPEARPGARRSLSRRCHVCEHGDGGAGG
jgi:hypothetical protein